MFLVIVGIIILFILLMAVEISDKHQEEVSRSYKNKKVTSKSINKNTNLKLVKEENKKKPATLKQKNFLNELIFRNDYEVIEKLLITNKLINKLNMELASTIISHILKVENYQENQIVTEEMFFKRFPISHEEDSFSISPEKERFLYSGNNLKLKCLGITEKRKRCTRLVSYPKYFCKLHFDEYKEYEFDQAISREYFYRSHCQKFLTNLFEFLTLESKMNNFKLEHTIKSIVKGHLGVNKYYKFVKQLENTSFKDLFFEYRFFNVFSHSLFESISGYPSQITEINKIWCECSIVSLKNNDLCFEHSVYSDFHLLYNFGYFQNETIDEFYLILNQLVIEDDFSELIEYYYTAIKYYHPDFKELEYE